MIRVLHVVASTRGGAAEHVRVLATRLDPARFRCTMALPDDGGHVHPRALAAAGVEVLVVNAFHPGAFPGLLRLRGALSADRFDIIHCHGIRAGLFVRLALATRRGPRPVVVYTLHGFHLPHYPSALKRGLMGWLERRLASSTDVVCCVSEHDRATVVATGIFPARMVRCVPNGVEIARFDRVADGAAWRRDAGIADDAFVVTMITRLSPPKDLATLVAGFERLSAVTPGAVLLIAGDGPLRSEVERRVRSSPARAAIRLLGVRQDVPAILAATDVLALCTGWEGLPISVLEGMAARRAVVATDVPGVRELVRDGTTGLLVPDADPGAVAAALGRLAGDAALRAAMGEAGFARVAAGYTHEQMLERLSSLYVELIGRGPVA